MLDEFEIRKIAASIVKEAKRTANYDQGTLFRSIAYTYIRNIVTFRQIFYGQFNDNSKLEKIATRQMPNGVQWKIIFTKLGGGTVEISRTRTGRRVQSSALSSILTGSTFNIKALIAKRKAKRLKDKDSE